MIRICKKVELLILGMGMATVVYPWCFITIRRTIPLPFSCPTRTRHFEACSRAFSDTKRCHEGITESVPAAPFGEYRYRYSVSRALRARNPRRTVRQGAA